MGAAQQLWTEFRSLSAQEVNKRIAEALKHKSTPARKMRADQVALIAKIARECDQDDFVEFYETGEVPPLKLSAAEMEMVRGGRLTITPFPIKMVMCGPTYMGPKPIWDDVIDPISPAIK